MSDVEGQPAASAGNAEVLDDDNEDKKPVLTQDEDPGAARILPASKGPR